MNKLSNRSITSVLCASLLAGVGGLLAAWLAWNHIPRRRRTDECIEKDRCELDGGREMEDHSEPDFFRKRGDFSVEAQKQYCCCVKEILATLGSLGGHTLQGHTLGEPLRRRPFHHLSKFIEEYCDAIADVVWVHTKLSEVSNGKIKLLEVSDLLLGVIAADENRHLVLEVSKGCQVVELATLAAVLDELLEDRRPIKANAKKRADAQRFWLQRAFYRTLGVSSEGAYDDTRSALPQEVEELILSMLRGLSDYARAAVANHKAWCQKHLKAANPFVMRAEDF